MNILLISSLSKDSGGWFRTRYIAESLAEAGNRITLVQPLSFALPKSFDLVLSLPRYLLKSLTTPADVVVGNKPFPNAVICLLLKKRLEGAYTVLDFDDYDAGFSAGTLERMFNRFVGYALPKFDLITTQSERLKKLIAQEYKIDGRKIHVLEHGVSELFFSPPERLDLDPLTAGWVESGCRVLFQAANLSSASSIDYIIEAMKPVVAAEPKVRLVVGGEGVMRKKYQRQVNRLGLGEYIHFCGRLARERVPSYLQVAELCLIYYKDIKSNYYRESMKLREYLAFGKPIVSNSIGYREDLAQYVYQSDKDPRSFADVIRRFLTDRHFGDHRELAGKRFIQDNLTWKKVGEDFSRTLSGRTGLT